MVNSALLSQSSPGPACHAWPPTLQALHIEENELTELPAGPYLGSLRELLLDWRTALCSAAPLRGATSLTRLLLNDHAALRIGPGDREVPPAEAAEPLLGTLAVLPALRLVHDIVYEEEVSRFTPPVAAVMWQLGQRCPHLEFQVLADTNVGWTLSSLIGALPNFSCAATFVS